MTHALAPDNRVGHPAEELLRAALHEGSLSLHHLAERAIARFLAHGTLGIVMGHFFTRLEQAELTELFASILATADLLGRSLVREREQQVLLSRRTHQESRRMLESAPVPKRKQDAPFSCGPACLRAVLARWGIVKDEAELTDALGTNAVRGTSAADIVRVAGQLDLCADESQGLTIADLVKATQVGVPVLCNVHMHGGGHWVVVTEADPQAGVLFLDPDDGDYQCLDPAEWNALWHDERDGQRIEHCGIAIAPKDYKAKRPESLAPVGYDYDGRIKELRALSYSAALLDVPDIRQPNRYSCGAAAAMCVGRYFGVGPETIREWMDALGTTAERSTHPFHIEAYLRQLGLQVESREKMMIADLAAYIARGWPVIVPVQDYGAQVPSEADFDYGHYLTVIGVGMGQRVFCQDSSLENLEREPGGDVLKRQASASGNISEPGRIMVRPETWNVVWHDQDIHGRRFIHYGIAAGPPVQREAQARDARTLLREAISFSSVKPMPPMQALAFFRSLLPRLGLDPLRWWSDLRRRAFTLAVATGQEMLQRAQSILTDRLATGENISAAPQEIENMLANMAVDQMPGGYGETVVRTNLMDAFNEGMQHELNQVQDTFPVYLYSNPDDSRSRPRHAEKNGKFYPSSVPFVQVRGMDIRDAANCRCVPIPQDKWTWAEKRAKGARIADGYVDPTES